MAVTTDVSAALLLCRAEFSLLFFSPITLPWLFSWIFRGSSSRSSTRTASRLYGASTFFFFFFSTTLSRVFITPRNSRVAYDISPQPSPFVLSPSAGRLSTVWNTSPPLQAFLHPNCLMLLHVFLGRKNDYLVRPPFYAVIRGTGWERTAVAGFVT